jgi:hypothetical protein
MYCLGEDQMRRRAYYAINKNKSITFRNEIKEEMASIQPQVQYIPQEPDGQTKLDTLQPHTIRDCHDSNTQDDGLSRLIYLYYYPKQSIFGH